MDADWPKIAPVLTTLIDILSCTAGWRNSAPFGSSMPSIIFRFAMLHLFPLLMDPSLWFFYKTFQLVGLCLQICSVIIKYINSSTLKSKEENITESNTFNAWDYIIEA